ncbi:hypothetical protein DY218_04070 [Streptomyces triticagri]|uniref:Uncharacterized protein n=1 Tax=Streptomyces triticagri TaxID=2293568 RepID=A0A372MAN0_9ACTN|nr:hypothetical protein [Streptomyces triticagri]RFU87941.1 hypothetical protein DY218_04070 [Streptomyces triticagri]
MRWFRDRQHRRAPATAEADTADTSTGTGTDTDTDTDTEDRVCDCCGRPLSRAGAYALPTERVTSSQAYWEAVFARTKALVESLDTSQQLQFYSRQLRATAAEETPWYVCEDCAAYFLFERAPARRHAVERTVPEFNGAVDPSGYVLYAAAAWEQVFGRWPAHVTRHAVTGHCPRCGRPLHTEAITSTVPGEDREICQPCTGRALHGSG